MEEENLVKKEETSKKKNKWLLLIILILILIIAGLLIFLLGGKNTNKYKIKLHYGNEIIDVDEDFDLSKLEVEGGEVAFLVDSKGNVIEPGEKLDSKEEYSAHLIPQGKEKVKVTYINDKKIFSIYYQKGAGLLLPKATAQKGLAFIGWFNEEENSFPKEMTPVMKDMTLIARYLKPNMKGSVCTLNCDTNNDGKCDLNCDTNGDGQPDTNIDKDGDGKADTNLKPDGNKMCILNCDTNNDGQPDTNKDTNGDGNPDLNVDENGDGKCDYNCDTNNDGKCDDKCVDGLVLTNKAWTTNYNYPCHATNLMQAVIMHNATYIHFIIDGKKIPESDFVEDTSGYYSKIYSFAYLDGSGKTVDFEYLGIANDNSDQKYYFKQTGTMTFSSNCDGPQLEYTLTFDPNGGTVNPTSMVFYKGQYLADLPFPTRSGYQFVGWFTAKEGGELVNNETKMPEKDMTIYAQWESNDTPKTTPTPTLSPKATAKPTATPAPKATVKPTTKPAATATPAPTATLAPTATPTPQDNGTISLSGNTCVVSGNRVNITATVTNARDDTVNWTADRCITINGSGKTVTVIPNGCGSSAQVTGTLNNGKSSSITLKIESPLTVTVKARGGEAAEFNSNIGAYVGNDLTIITNIPAYITGNGLLGDSSALRTSAQTNGAAQANVTITTPCGQTKTVKTYPVIN